MSACPTSFQAVRAAQDEQIRLKDVEINELKSLRMDLDKELRDTRTVADRVCLTHCMTTCCCLASVKIICCIQVNDRKGKPAFSCIFKH